MPLETIIAKNWSDYELIQSGDGRRLERFGQNYISRPESNALWGTSEKHAAWKATQGVFEQGEWTKEPTAKGWNMKWHGVEFALKPTPFRHVGIFPEQSANWEWVTKIIEDSVNLLVGTDKGNINYYNVSFSHYLVFCLFFYIYIYIYGVYL